MVVNVRGNLSGTEKLVREKTDGFEMEKNIFFLIDKEKFNFSKMRNDAVGLTFLYKKKLVHLK